MSADTNTDLIQPGGGESAHKDTFAKDNLPPPDLWPRIDFSALPELRRYAPRLNAVHELLDRAVSDYGWAARPAIHYQDVTWTYGELRDRVNKIAAVIVDDMGVETGNRVLLSGANSPMMAACWLAILKTGAIAVATMPLLRAREISVVVEKANIRHALFDAALADELANTRERAPQLADMRSFSALGDGNGDVDRLMAGKDAIFSTVDTAADDTALIAFTSGTTGEPKGTMHFHRDVLAMCDTFARHVFKPAPDDVYIGSPPLAFTFGLGAQLCFPLRFGSSVVFYPGPPTAESLMENIEKYRCSVLYTAPVMFRILADLVDRGTHDVSSLAKCVSAGETLPLPTFEAFQRATEIKIIDGLGSTEMIHIFVSAAGDDIRPGATGKAIPGYEACIMDEDGVILDPPCDGFLAVRGPTGCRYLNNLERQKIYVKDGWNLPGDRYRQDEDGHFWYVARADDMIISAGYNIGGPEVEAVLLDHPKVMECAVVGQPDEKRGNIVKAFVVLRDGAVGNDDLVKELQDFVKSEIAPYKYPRAVEFVGDLPKTETGKIQRFKLRD